MSTCCLWGSDWPPTLDRRTQEDTRVRRPTHDQSDATRKQRAGVEMSSPDSDLLQGGSQGVAVLLVDAVPLQTRQHFQLLVGPERQQVNDAVPEGPLGHSVVGKALADGVGWVDGHGALALGSDLRSRKRRFTNMDLFSL